MGGGRLRTAFFGRLLAAALSILGAPGAGARTQKRSAHARSPRCARHATTRCRARPKACPSRRAGSRRRAGTRRRSRGHSPCRRRLRPPHRPVTPAATGVPAPAPGASGGSGPASSGGSASHPGPGVAPAGPGSSRPMSSGATTSAGSALSPASFSIGEPQWTTVGATGCGTNGDGEPAIHVSLANDVFLGSEEGLGNGSDAWRDLGGVGGSGAQACSLEYRGQPNALVPGLGLSGGDIDLAWASAPNAQRTFNLYVASPNAEPGFWAYQSYVAANSPADQNNTDNYDTAFVSVSHDGGFTWDARPIPCSFASTPASPDPTQRGLDHNFPNVSVDPAGNLWASWSDDRNVFTAVSADHGSTWACSGPVSTNTAQAIFPWLVATSAGVDLVYYGSPTAPNSPQPQTFSVYFAQNPSASTGGWATPQQLTAVHKGPVCESGVTCTDGRQLLDDFGVDTDQSGWAHIAFTSDADDQFKFSPGGPNSATGYAVQTGGTPVGAPN